MQKIVTELGKKQKRFIRNNYKTKSFQEMAKKLSVSEKTISSYLNKLGKNTSKPQPANKEGGNSYFSSVLEIKIFLSDNLDFLFGLSFFIIIVYLNSLNGEFVSDDIAGIVNHPLTRDLMGSIRDLHFTRIVFAINFAIFGMNHVSLHIFSVLLHLIIAVLTFIFVTQVFGKRVAMLSTLLFALHPVNTEAVSWISGLVYLINGISFLVIANLYIIYRNTNNKKYYWAAVVVYVLTLIFTQNVWALIIPALLVVVEVFFIHKKSDLKKLYLLAPYLITSLGLLLFLKQSVTSRISEIGLNPSSTPFLQRIPFTIFMAAKLLIFPKSLSLYHEEGTEQIVYLIMIFLTIVFVAILPLLWKKNKIIAGLLVFIAAAMLPAFSPIQISWFIADRYLYLGSISFSILVTLLFLKIENKTAIKNTANILVATLLVIYSARVVIRNYDWGTRKRLWESTARVSPNSPRVHNNLGDVYGGEGDIKRSISEFERAIELDPNYADALHNLGNTYMQLGVFDAAEFYLKKSFEINPSLYQAPFKLGVIEYERKNYDGAIEYMNIVLKINPYSEDAKQAIQFIESQKNENDTL